MGLTSREKGTEVPRLGGTAGSSTPLGRLCAQEDDLGVGRNSRGPSRPFRKNKRPNPVLRPSFTADSGRSQAAALAAGEWARSGAREFKAKVRLM